MGDLGIGGEAEIAGERQAGGGAAEYGNGATGLEPPDELSGSLGATGTWSLMGAPCENEGAQLFGGEPSETCGSSATSGSVDRFSPQATSAFSMCAGGGAVAVIGGRLA